MVVNRTRKLFGALLLPIALVLSPLFASAQVPVAAATAPGDCQPSNRGALALPTTQRTPAPSEGLEAYDVVLEVPNLCVRRLSLDVDNLDAHVSLNLQLANLLHINAGADVYIGTVDLTISGVRAEALLLVDLDNVYQVVDQALTVIDQNPQLVSKLTGTLQNTVRTVGGVANTALQPGGVVSQAVGVVGQTLGNLTQPGGVLTQTVNTLGQTLQTTFDVTGNLVERTLDTTGNILGSRTVGNLLNLPALGETTNAANQTVRQVRDTAGNLLELTLNSAGQIASARLLEQANSIQR
jgi:YD repeat-containing protein